MDKFSVSGATTSYVSIPNGCPGDDVNVGVSRDLMLVDIEPAAALKDEDALCLASS